MSPDEYQDHVRAVVDTAPPLSDDQKARLAMLVRVEPADDDAREAVA